MHDRSSKLQIKMTLDTLFCNSCRKSFRLATFKLAGEEVTEPAFKKGDDSTEKKEPDTPARGPETYARAFTHGTRVEAVVDEMFQVLAETDLTHELVLVAVHARELSDMGKNVLKAVGELKGVDVTESVLDVGVDNQFREAEDFATQVEGVSKTRFFAFFGREGFDGLEVKVVVKMEIVKVLAVDQEVEHVVALATHLEANFDPVQFRELKKFCGLELAEKVLLSLGF